jgi:hypothetical protein
MLQKLLLLSILIMSVAIPVRTSMEKDRALGLTKTIKYFIAYAAFYLFALLYLYPRLEGH